MTSSDTQTAMGSDQLATMLVDWNATEATFPFESCIHELFELQVSRTPYSPAVACEGISVSYSDLNIRANRLARFLRSLGVGPDSRVALCATRSSNMLVGLWAVLKAGGSYVPLDPTYPVDRLRCMLIDSNPTVVLADTSTHHIVEAASAEVGVLDLNDDSEWRDSPSSNLDRDGLTPDNLAYLIYTSGSTGVPKGVMIEHRGLINYLSWARDAYSPTKGAIVSSSLSFDATITSLFLPLISGSMVDLLSEGSELDGLEKALLNGYAGLLKITPAHLELLGQRLASSNSLNARPVFVVGGDVLTASTIDVWQRLFPEGRIINEYGPTETVVGRIAFDVPKAYAFPLVPIGRPIWNTRVYILDDHRHPVPIGVTGELYIGGVGVARGYWNRPDLTTERFIPSPFVEGDRLYKTGDLARYLPDGTIEFIGRNDTQVKIRGVRIELGEIESNLVQHESIREVVVLVQEGVSGDKRLAAYYTVAEGTISVSARALRRYLQTRLPEYMVPTQYVELEHFPLTPNGKVDRKVLPV